MPGTHPIADPNQGKTTNNTAQKKASGKIAETIGPTSRFPMNEAGDHCPNIPNVIGSVANWAETRLNRTQRNPNIWSRFLIGATVTNAADDAIDSQKPTLFAISGISKSRNAEASISDVIASGFRPNRDAGIISVANTAARNAAGPNPTIAT